MKLSVMKLSVFAVVAAALVALTSPALVETFVSADKEAWKQRTPPITARDAAEQAVGGTRVVFIDVREPREYREFHIPGAHSIPLYDLHSADLSSTEDADIVIAYCLKDFRGWEGAKILQNRGVNNVRVLQGFGTRAWQNDDLPLAGKHTGLSDDEAMAALREKFAEVQP